MSKRAIFDELMEGFDALEASREGKPPYRTTELALEQPPENRPEQVPDRSAPNPVDSGSA